MQQRPRTIIITGGTVSGIGKGITAASLGRLLINQGFSVLPVKADPYLNQDAGTMNPFQHGEVFVTEDGAETDLDLGHYERFLDVNVNKSSNFTGGSVYQAVMEYEREGEYLGKTIQLIPHVTDEIKRRIDNAGASNPDFLTVEIGGTVGDIEALLFVEAARQYRMDHPGRVISVHVVKMDYLYPSDEGKTKPIQHAVTLLRSYGLQPDILIVRCKRPITKDEREKISLFTGVPVSRVIAAEDARSLYEIPAALEANGMTKAVLECFPGLSPTNGKKHREDWAAMLKKCGEQKGELKIGLVGKYIDHSDAYLSVIEAVHHAGIAHKVHTKIVPINSEDANVAEQVKQVDAIIIPGGFGNRGIEGKITAISTARKEKIPFMGICLGLQTAVIEFARNSAQLKAATSTEFDEKTPHPIVAFLPGQEGLRRKGGTMRLGSYPAVLTKGSLAEEIYKKYRPLEFKGQEITERHRHRYEVNPEYHDILTKAGLVISGMSPDGQLAEFIELPRTVHPYFIATQAHPEFRSRPHAPHPLFAGLIAAALK
ncbi:CTP synthase (glutamine hydrolyzing) [soil metagenome]